MTSFKTSTLDEQQSQLGLAVLLTDRFTRSNRLIGEMSVRIAGRSELPLRKPHEAVFLFIGLSSGQYAVQIRSNEERGAGMHRAERPYYRDLNLQIAVPSPDPLWPAFPDLSLADKSKPLDDPSQPAAYLAQRKLATLQPTPAYPFPDGATLVPRNCLRRRETAAGCQSAGWCGLGVRDR